jgi:hypothetical protein
VRLLLDAGADPNGGALLSHAVRRERGPEFLPNAAPISTVAAERRGAATCRSVRRTSMRSSVAERTRFRRLQRSAPRPHSHAKTSSWAQSRAASRPRELGPRFRGVVGGGPAGTLLHHAAWVGDPAVAETLLARGADPTAPSGAEFDTPLAWTVLGSQYWQIPGRDYVRVAELLSRAGAELEPRFADVAHGPLEGWLEGRI